MSPRVSLTVGARVYAVLAGEVVGVQLLDKAAPSGWWATVEGKTGPDGRAVVERFETRALHGSAGAATAALTAAPPATRRNRA